MRVLLPPKSYTYTENLDVDATGISGKEQRLTQGSLKSHTASIRHKRRTARLAKVPEGRREKVQQSADGVVGDLFNAEGSNMKTKERPELL